VGYTIHFSTGIKKAAGINLRLLSLDTLAYVLHLAVSVIESNTQIGTGSRYTASQCISKQAGFDLGIG